MAADLTIVESVGQALTEWTPQGSLIPIAETIYSLGKTLFDDSPDIDSLTEYQQETNNKLDTLSEDIQESTTNMTELNDSIQNLTSSIDAFMGFQYFIFGTIFSILFVGFLGTRIKRLMSWRKLKKMEGYM